jgi:hypothetical protein
MSKRHKRKASSGDPWQRARVFATVVEIIVELLKWCTGGGPGRL